MKNILFTIIFIFFSLGCSKEKETLKVEDIILDKGFSIEYIRDVIKNGSNQLGYPMGAMPPMMARGADAEAIAAYIVGGMKGKQPASFAACASCHGIDGKGMSGMSPSLYPSNLNLYKDACINGVKHKCIFLGNFYKYGKGSEHNLTKAELFYKKGRYENYDDKKLSNLEEAKEYDDKKISILQSVINIILSNFIYSVVIGAVVLFIIGEVRINRGGDGLDDHYFKELKFLVEHPREKYISYQLSAKETTKRLQEYAIRDIYEMQAIFNGIRTNGMISNKHRSGYRSDLAEDFYCYVRDGFLASMRQHFYFDKNKNYAERILNQIDDEAFLLSKSIIGIGEKSD